jgi:hypothetical protein
VRYKGIFILIFFAIMLFRGGLLIYENLSALATIPTFGMMPGEGVPDLEYRLGQPGVEVGDHLSPAEEAARRRHNIYCPNASYLPIEDVRALVRVKSEIVEEMVLLDPSPSNFWVTHRDEIISRSIVTPKGPDFRLDTLAKKLNSLRLSGTNSKEFKQFQRIRTNFESFGTFN